jgi:hypothetical protein
MPVTALAITAVLRSTLKGFACALTILGMIATVIAIPTADFAQSLDDPNKKLQAQFVPRIDMQRGARNENPRLDLDLNLPDGRLVGRIAGLGCNRHPTLSQCTERLFICKTVFQHSAS